MAVAPRVSVIVPAYNAAGYLERALDSALVQTMSDLEVIVVDDASSDATFEVACKIAARSPRVRVLRNERNSGENASRNRAISAARGEWIALLDADDEWLPERLERMLALADEADVISDDVYIVEGSFIKSDEPVLWSLVQRQGLTATETCQLSLLDFARYDLGLLQPLIRRSFLKRYGLAYDPTVRYAEDFLLFFEILALGARWLQLPHAYYLYHKNVGSLSTNKREFWQSVVESTQALFNHPAVAENPALAAALEHRIQEARAQLVFRTAWNNLCRRNFAELARQMYNQPSSFPLILSFVVERLYLRIVWRARRFSGRRR